MTRYDNIRGPETPHYDKSHLTQAERLQLVACNSTATDYPRHASIAQLFEEQVALAPEAVALVHGQQQISYRELNGQANRLAHHLRGLGVGPEALVGIAMERSVELIVAILGILKAGGAYLPLDPSYPVERLRYMLDDAQVSVVLTARRGEGERGRGGEIGNFSPSPPLPLSPSVVDLEADWDHIAQQPATNPDSGATGDHLAYVMYTSGSTGRPKGVCIPQRGVVRLVKATNYAELTSREVFLQFAPISFDAATFEIWGALLNGAKLVLFPPHIPSLEELGQALQRYGITTLWLTAGLFHQMVREQPQALRAVRQVLAGGDVLAVPQVSQVLQALRPGAVLINGYGPTENTTFSTCYAMDDIAQVGPTVAIGTPIANTQVYILDAQMQPVPLGVPGELYVGGDGLARGYLNRPDLTAERFVPNPFAQERLEIRDWRLGGVNSPISNLQSPISPQMRLYKTGDLCRYREDGNIEFLGRIDTQVKIRGFRIELGEIEAHLAQHRAVRESVVLAREDVPGTKRLVAYVVPRDWRLEIGDSASDNLQSPISNLPQELRAFLKERLPDYMVPSAFVSLEALPLNANGKVDRRALPAPQAAQADEQHYVPPATPTEGRLAELWARLLGVELVGRQDDFFELGGHSLIATQLASAVREGFAVELPLSCLFDHPTLEAFAQQIDAQGQQLRIPPILPAAHDDDPSTSSGQDQPLSFAQQRLWFLHQWQPDSPLYNIVVAYRLTGPLFAMVLERSLNEIVRRHASLRTTFPTVAGEPVQRIAAELTLPLQVRDLRRLPAGEREAQALSFMQQEGRRPFDLARGPLLSAALVRLSDHAYMLLLNMHHIISDGWSMEIFMRELLTLYQGYVSGGTAPLPPLPVQYTDYAAWQRSWLEDARDQAGSPLQQQLDYWRHTLAGAPALLELPTDRPRPPVQTFQGAQTSFALAPALAADLAALGRRAGATLFMTLLAAWATLLHRYSGQREVVIGVPIANRTRKEVESLIGFFVNTLALRIDLSDGPAFPALLRRVRAAALGAYTHQDLPFERLVTALHPERNLSHSPLFQAMFAFQNEDFTALRLPNLTVSPLKLDLGTAMFDLTLEVIDTAQGLQATIEYNTDLFDAATIARMAGHFETLLAAIAVEHALPVSRLPLLTAGESAQLLDQWNATWIDAPQDRPIHALFEAQAARTPNAVAVMFDHQPPRTKNQEPRTKNQEPSGEDSGSQFSVLGSAQGSQFSILNSQFSYMSYRELNQRANQVAHHLRALGVGPDVLVGIAMERSVEMLVGLLGILKAGGAYVPIDPSYPAERLRFMLADARVSVLLTSKEIRDWRLEIAQGAPSPISNLRGRLEIGD